MGGEGMFRRRRSQRLGSRVLKLGARGTDVGELQQKLKEFGYEPGPVDNIFGYLTQEALEFFQRDYRLRVDGIAGEEVFTLIQQRKLPVRRRVHTVQPGETLADIAKMYEVGPEAFFDHQTATIYPGQQLVFYDREVWAVLPPNLPARESYTAHQDYLTGVFIPVNPEQPKAYDLRSIQTGIIAQVEFTRADEMVSIHTILTKRKVRRRFFQFCAELLEKADGIYLPWEGISRVDGARYYHLLKRIKKMAGDKRLVICLTPTMPRWNLLGGIDFTVVGRLVDQVVVKLPAPKVDQALLDKAQLERLIHKMLNYVPAYKLLLLLPVHACLWQVNDTSVCQRLSHAEAMTKVFRHGARLETDQEGYSGHYRFLAQGEEWLLRINSLNQLHQAVALTNHYNLAGIVVDSLGEEDKRFWKKLRSHFCIRKKL